MELFYSGGGRSNPDFRYKVRVKKLVSGMSGMMEWCDDYPVTGEGHFQRYYIDWRDGADDWDSDCAIFQFEWEEPAIMFALSFGDSLA